MVRCGAVLSTAAVETGVILWFGEPGLPVVSLDAVGLGEGDAGLVGGVLAG